MRGSSWKRVAVPDYATTSSTAVVLSATVVRGRSFQFFMGRALLITAHCSAREAMKTYGVLRANCLTYKTARKRRRVPHARAPQRVASRANRSFAKRGDISAHETEVRSSV